MAINRARHARKKGRPVQLDDAPSPEQVEVFLKTYSEDLCQYDARKAAGLSRSQVARLMVDPAFLTRIDDIKADLTERVEAAAYRNAIRRGDKDLIKLILQAKLAQEYGPRANVNLNLTAEQVKAMSDDELMALRDKLSKR